MLTPANSLVPEDLTNWSPPSLEMVVHELIDPPISQYKNTPCDTTPTHNFKPLAHIDDSEPSVELDFFTPQTSPLNNNLATSPDRSSQEHSRPVFSLPETVTSGQLEDYTDSPSPIILTRRRRPLVESDESAEEELNTKKEWDESSSKLFDKDSNYRKDSNEGYGPLFIPALLSRAVGNENEEKSFSVEPDDSRELGSSRSPLLLGKSKFHGKLALVNRTTIVLDDSHSDDSDNDLTIKFGLGRRFTPKQPKISTIETPPSKKNQITTPVFQERSTFIKETDKLTDLLESRLRDEDGLSSNKCKVQNRKIPSTSARQSSKLDPQQIPKTPNLNLDSEDELPIRIKSLDHQRRIVIESSSEDEKDKEEQGETSDEDKGNLPSLNTENDKTRKIDKIKDYDYDADTLARTLEETRIAMASSTDLTNFDEHPFSDDDEGTPSSNKVHRFSLSIDLAAQHSHLHHDSSNDNIWDEDMWIPIRNVTPRTPKRREPLSSISLSVITPKKPAAKQTTKKDFKMKRQMLAEELYNEYNRKIFLEKLPNILQIVWSVTLNTTAGRAISKREYIGGEWKYSSKIELSAKVVDDYDKLKNTLAHELCHVAAWIINGVSKPPHGQVFKSWASRFSSIYPELNVTTCHNYEIDYKYRWECTNVACRKIYGRHSKSIDTTKHTCGICRGRLQSLQKVKADGTPYKERAPNRFQIFVKDNFKRIKDLNPHTSHAEVMAILGKEYKSTVNVERGRDLL